VATAPNLIPDLVESTALRTKLVEEAADLLHHAHERLLREPWKPTAAWY
jgi:hypothetical protein